jgi:hypothetical protein
MQTICCRRCSVYLYIFIKDMKLLFFIHCNSRTGRSTYSDPQYYSILFKKILGVLLLLEVFWIWVQKFPKLLKKIIIHFRSSCCSGSRNSNSLQPIVQLSFPKLILIWSRSQWPRGLKHELSSLARKLGSWVGIPLKPWMSVLCAFTLFVLFCVGGSGLTTGWFPVKGVLPIVYKIKKLKSGQGPAKDCRTIIIIIIIIIIFCGAFWHFRKELTNPKTNSILKSFM